MHSTFPFCGIVLLDSASSIVHFEIPNSDEFWEGNTIVVNPLRATEISNSVCLSDNVETLVMLNIAPEGSEIYVGTSDLVELLSLQCSEVKDETPVPDCPCVGVETFPLDIAKSHFICSFGDTEMIGLACLLGDTEMQGPHCSNGKVEVEMLYPD